MTHPEPDKTIRKLLLDMILAEAQKVREPARPEDHTFSLHNEQYEGVWTALHAAASERIKPYPGHNPLRRVVREVAHELIADGVLLPGKVDQTGDWGQRSYSVSFTRRGLEWARGAYRVKSQPHEVLKALATVGNDHPDTVTPAVIALAQEALRCIEGRCFRAAVVLIGVACEEAVTALMEALCDLKGYEKVNGWRDQNDRARSFGPRWTAAREVLKAVKENLRSQLSRPRPDWWSLWEGLPESLVPLGEAVRISRNTAAHDADHRFTHLEAATLFCGLPYQLRWVAEVQNFLSAPPICVSLKGVERP
jgi:hypothetical protein